MAVLVEHTDSSLRAERARIIASLPATEELMRSLAAEWKLPSDLAMQVRRLEQIDWLLGEN